MSNIKRIGRNALGAVVAVCILSLPLVAQGGAEEIRITAGKSVVIDYPEDVSRISTSSPDVVDYVPVSTREILLHAKNVGAATLVIWAKSGQRNFYNVSVEYNLEPIRKLLKDTFPSEELRLVSARDTVTVSGTVSSPAVVERAMATIAPLVKTAINNLKSRPLPVDKQILLRVKFAELSRNYGSQFAVNLVSTGDKTVGQTSTGQFGSTKPLSLGGTGQTNAFSISDALNIFAFRPDLNLAAFLKLIQTNGMLQILAEPNLVTSNGKEASFLVGGEFPIPILQGGGNAGSVTIQFREFGIRLTFNPSITENGTMKMYVKPEVSTIDLARAVSFNGFTIPALSTRRVESTIELAPGQSFVIGGLIDDRVTETFSKIPGLSSIPLLGTLFKSRDENKQKSELIVVVTPEIVEPLDAADPKLQPQLPGDFMRPMMVPNGYPMGSNVGAGAAANRGPAVTKKKDSWQGNKQGK